MTITEVDRREAFRAGVRTWLDQHAPAKGSPEDFSAAHVVSARTKDEFEALEHEALERTKHWQRSLLAIAVEMVPPLLFQFGTEERRLAHLPKIVRGDEAWCQLISEPDAGSDLTSVATFAEPTDGGWSVSGQKVWTSGATSADFALLLARTDRSRPGRAGVSLFALDRAQPGLSEHGRGRPGAAPDNM